MSLSMAATTALVRITWAVRRGGERVAAPIPDRLAKIADVSHDSVNGCDVYTLTPKSGATGTEILYAPGGAYVHPIGGLHWALIQRILEQTGATITVALYGLAPEHRMPEAYAMLDKVYDGIVERAGSEHPVYLAGDSAGGGLAIGQAIRCRDAHKQRPAAVILFSPWVELTMANPAIGPLEPKDPMLRRASLADAGRQWAEDPSDPLASPINDSLAGLPPLWIYQGGRELFLPDVEAFARKAEAAGTEVHLLVEPKAFHVYVGALWTPESKAAIDNLVARLKAA
jgi:monoterpene epsilon-lactone hydrolase